MAAFRDNPCFVATVMSSFPKKAFRAKQADFPNLSR
jgi:hypothetical protein